MKTTIQEPAKEDKVVRMLTKTLETVEENKASTKENNKRIGRLEALYNKLANRHAGI